MFCLQLNAAARNLTEGIENGSDQPSGVAKPARKSLTGETSKSEPKRHTMHFVGQRDGESQSVGLQRRSLDISSSERLAGDNTRQVWVFKWKCETQAWGGCFPVPSALCTNYSSNISVDQIIYMIVLFFIIYIHCTEIYTLKVIPQK